MLPDKSLFKQQLLLSLANEWQKQICKIDKKKIVSIYFGGGTPALIGPKGIGTILNWIFTSKLQIAPDCEITLEANPENVTQPLMREFADTGINRVSIGVQSLDDSTLNVLERRHGAKVAVQAVERFIFRRYS